MAPASSPATAPLYYQRADASDDDYVAAPNATRDVAPGWSPPARDVEALMQQFDDDPVQVVIRFLTLAHQVQQLAERIEQRITDLDRAVSERLEGGAAGPSIEQMRASLDGLLAREIL